MDEIFETIGRGRHEGKLYELIGIGGEDDDDVDVHCPILKYTL